MSEVSSVNGSNSSAAPDAAADPSQNGAPPGGTSGDLTGNTKLHDLSELKEKAPDLYKKMMEGIASNIVREMREHNERLKELLRKSQQR